MFSDIWSKKRISTDDEGLRIITKISNEKSNVVVKPIFLLESPTNHHSYTCYLKSCHLCQKPLNFDKEIYMYSGDLGFCSVECRERQIYLDEAKEMEASTQRIMSTFRQRRRDGGGRCETAMLLEDFRRRRRNFSSERERVVFSLS